ncbi:hypothetical protein VNO77_05856 [Canavalia gladiata]|uniref:Uncharacterized protein n=1 Tax=Canavalia gladiata TaxID=3824 RepID=A0AAN9MZ37_CANGL
MGIKNSPELDPGKQRSEELNAHRREKKAKHFLLWGMLFIELDLNQKQPAMVIKGPYQFLDGRAKQYSVIEEVLKCNATNSVPMPHN